MRFNFRILKGREIKPKGLGAAQSNPNLLVVVQALDVVLRQQLALRRLLRAVVLHALREVLHDCG
jgi:hypothetical protein